MTIQTNTTDRKALARAIAEILGTKARYLGMPSCSFQIGDFTLDRAGNLTGDDFTALQAFLQERGMLPEEDAPDAGADSEAEPEKETVDRMDISIPAGDCTVEQLRNLTYMLYSKQEVINRMTRSDTLCIPDCLIEALKSACPDSPDGFTCLLDACRPDGLSGFDFRDGRVSMTFPFSEAEPDRWTTYAGLLNRVFDTVKKATRIHPAKTVITAESEKYQAHIWLVRLGYSGAAVRAERQILLGHLSGYCAFASSGDAQKHKDKYAAIRLEKRLARQGNTHSNVSTEGACDHD